MRSGKKVSRGFLSQQTHRELEVVRPYWVARNFIPQIIKSRCNGHHDILKLPLIKDFLKRGHYKMFTESSISRQQISETQKINNHFKYPSEYQYLNDNLEGFKSKRQDNIKHNSIVNQHYLQSKRQQLNKNKNQIFLKEQQNSRHKSKFESPVQDYLVFQQQYINRNKSLAVGKQSLFHLPQLNHINRNSNFYNPRIFSPVMSNRSIIQYQKQKAEELQNQNFIIKKQKQNKDISKILKQHTLLKQQRFSILGKKQRQKQKSDTSSIIDYDKTTLIQQYAMIANILQATLIKQQKFLNQNTSKKIMTLMATLNILKNNLQFQGLRVILQKYIPKASIEIIKQIEKVLVKSTKYQQITKQIQEKFQERNIVVKKIQRSSILQNQNHKKILKNTDRYLISKLSNQENKQDKQYSSHKLKKHYRYQSDSIMMSRYKHEQQTKQQPLQIQINNRVSSNKKNKMNKKYHNKYQILNVSNKKSFHKNKLSEGFQKNKKIISHEKISKISKGKIKNNNKQIKILTKQFKQFDKDKLQRIRNVNKNKNRRPKSHKLIRRIADGQYNTKIIQSQRVIMGFGNKKPVRASFKKYLQSQKDSYSKRAKTTTNNNSKYQSSITTPELILQIEDNNQFKIEQKQLQHYKQQDEEQSNQYDTLVRHKHINKAKINRFKMDLYDNIRLPSHNSQSDEEQEQEQAFKTQIKKRITIQYEQGVDWNDVVRRVPKKKIRKINIQNDEKNKTRKKYQINGRVMMALHRQVYRILDDRDIPQLQQIRNILLQNQRKIVEVRLKQQYIPQSSNGNQQKWINGLDFAIKINTNNRQHLGGMRHAKVIVRNDAESDPVQLYQIALRQIQISERLQQKQRLQIFAKQSINILQKSQFRNEVYSYGF